jgi:hypothetical protein
MKLRVNKFYQGWASDDDGYEVPWEPGMVVDVDAICAKYLLATFPDRFDEVKSRRRSKPDEDVKE